MDRDGIAGLGAFDMEGSGERVAGFVEVFAVEVLSAGVESFRDHGIAGCDVGKDGVGL